MSLKKRRRSRPPRPPLDIAQILSWADEYHRRTGAWPTRNAGPIDGTLDETWYNVSAALFHGRRGLRPGSSLARLLAEQRGVRNFKALPALDAAQILAWADAYHHRIGAWPNRHCGPIADAPGETWLAVETALRDGLRGCPGGSSLADLLETRRGVRNIHNLPLLSVERILTWADAYHQRTSRWPQATSGPIEDAPGETWLAADAALRHGKRGLPGGSSLRLLREHAQE